MSAEAAAPPATESAPAGRLDELQERFVLHWGEMASAWGIPRTMAQIHALLYISPEPLAVDDIMARLRISRGNVSMSLRGLEDWGVIQRVHYTGDRREYFRSLTDVWELSRTIVRERKRREFDPMMRSLREFLADAGAAGSPISADGTDGAANDVAMELYRERLGNLLSALELVDQACELLLPCDPREVAAMWEKPNASGVGPAGDEP